MTKSIIGKFKAAIRKYNLISKKDKIVVGVSGGPDSIALLYLLKSLKSELKLTLIVAHLDHCLRKDSYKDAGFVEKIAEKLSFPFIAGKINVKELAKKGSLEEIARNARLGFLFKVAKDFKADKIALGHNFDDQAETVLMRLIRGSGLYGLTGILPKRKIAGFSIVRPLIETSRKEIEAYLKRKRIHPCFDKSNLSDIYFRNKIRNKLLPLLEKEYNQNIREVLSNTAISAGNDYDYLSKEANRFVRRFGPRLNLAKFQKLHPSLQNLVLRLSIVRVNGSLRGVGFRHIKEINDLIDNRPFNSIVDLPKGTSVVKKKTVLLFYRRSAVKNLDLS